MTNGIASRRADRYSLSRRLSSSTADLNELDSLPLITPSQARRRLRQRLLGAIDEAAAMVRAIPRAESSTSHISYSNEATLSSEGSDEKIFDSGNFLTHSRNKNGNGSSSCGHDVVPLPETHGVFPPQPLLCRDRIFVSHGRNMYTREIFSANGAPLKMDYNKLNALRGVAIQHVCPPQQASQTPMATSDPTLSSPSLTTPLTPSSVESFDCSTKSVKTRVNTIVVRNVDPTAKGLVLSLNVRMLKPDGTSKDMEFAIDMPNFEPTSVRVDDRTAYFR